MKTERENEFSNLDSLIYFSLVFSTLCNVLPQTQLFQTMDISFLTVSTVMSPARASQVPFLKVS